ncbi:MAG: hypothetical protein ACYC8T_34960, partial [Myxococcaceae bacterium]
MDSSSGQYRLADEPVGSVTSRLVVAPLFPLLAFMLAGGWLGWPWLVFNGFAVKSPTRWKELAVAAAGLGGTVALFIGIVVLLMNNVVEKPALPYLFLGITVFQLGCAYLIHQLQERTFEVYRYYGGEVKNGVV